MKNGTILKTLRQKLTTADIAAVFLLLLLIVYLILCARNGIGVPDESFYLTIPQRVFNGDGLISDDWHVSQFSSFMQYPFYVLFRWITGSTEGIILYFRCLYIFFQCLCSVICWTAFRRYGYKGLIGIAYFAFFVPVSVMAVNYYTASIWPAMILASAFFRKRKPGGLLLSVYGVLIALTALAEPMTALLWFFYTGAVLVRFLDAKRKAPRVQQYAFLLLPKTFRFLLYGVLLAAGLFLPYLFKNNSLTDISANFVHLFTGTEYDFGSGNFLLSTNLLKEVLQLYGTVPAFGIAILTLLAFVLRRFRTILKSFFTLALLVLTTLAFWKLQGASLSGPAYSLLIRYFGFPMFLSGPACMLLLEERDRKLEAFWWITFSVGLLTDISSEIMIGTAAFTSGAASVILMLQLLSESFCSFRSNKTKWKRAAFAVVSLSAALLLTENIGAYVMFDLNRINTTFIEDCSAVDPDKGNADLQIEKGPMKGLYTTFRIHRIYNAYLQDLDRIKMERTGSFYVYGLYGYLYLYLYDAPSSSLSAWYVKNEESRQLEYYSLHPDKIPEYVYIPYYYCFTYRTVTTDRNDDLTVEQKLQNLQSLFVCHVTEGEAGLIVHVTGAK